MTKSTSMKGSSETATRGEEAVGEGLPPIMQAHDLLGAELAALEQELKNTDASGPEPRYVLDRLEDRVRDLASDHRDLRRQIASLVTLIEEAADTGAGISALSFPLSPGPAIRDRLRAYVGSALLIFERAARAALHFLRPPGEAGLHYHLQLPAFDSLPQLTLIIPADQLSKAEVARLEVALERQTDQGFERLLGASDTVATDFVGVLTSAAAELPATVVETVRLLLASERLAFVIVPVGRGFLIVVRRDLWRAETGIAVDALAALARLKGWPVVGKVLCPLAAKHGLPALAPLVEAGRRGAIGWREPYIVGSRGTGRVEHSVAPADVRGAVSANIDCGRDATLVVVGAPLTGGLEVLLSQIVRSLSGSRRVLVVAVPPGDSLTTRRLEQLTHLTPSIYSWGNSFAPQVLASLTAWLIARHRVTSVIDIGADVQLGAELRTIFPDLRLVALPLSRAASQVGSWSSYDSVLAVTRELSAAFRTVAGEGSVQFFNHANRSAGSRARADSPEPGDRSADHSAGEPDTRLLVTMHTDLLPVKRPEDFLALAHRFRTDDRFEFLLVGDGPLAANIGDLILALDLRNCTWRRADGSLADVVERTDIACITAEQELFPIFATAALAARKPVLAADVDDLGALLGEGPCGLVVPRSGDVEAFAEGLSSLAEPGYRRQLGERGPEVVGRWCRPEPHLDALGRALAAEL